jgi:hypothetical protein
MNQLRRILRTIVLLALALWIAPGVAPAQQIPPEVASSTPQERAKVLTLVMKEKLALTPEQLPKVEAINLDAAQKMEPVLKGSEGPLVKMRTSKQVEQGKEAALQNVLTPQQFQQFLAGRDEMKQKAEQKLMEKRKSSGQ